MESKQFSSPAGPREVRGGGCPASESRQPQPRRLRSVLGVPEKATPSLAAVLAPGSAPVLPPLPTHPLHLPAGPLAPPHSWGTVAPAIHQIGGGFSLRRLSFCFYACFTSLPHLERVPLPSPPGSAVRRGHGAPLKTPPEPRESSQVPPWKAHGLRSALPATGRGQPWRPKAPRGGVLGRWVSSMWGRRRLSIAEPRSPLAPTFSPFLAGSWTRSRGCACRDGG